jgi:hypothetical protein
VTYSEEEGGAVGGLLAGRLDDLLSEAQFKLRDGRHDHLARAVAMARNERNLRRQRDEKEARNMSMERVTIGRAVHYVAYGTPGGEFPAGICRAATVTQVHDQDGGREQPNVGLMVANPTGLFFNVNIPYDSHKHPGSWHWPERA